MPIFEGFINHSYSDKNQRYEVLKAITALGGELLPDQYIEEQFEPWEDQMYIDFRIDGHVVTLHYERDLGVFLLSDTAEVGELEALRNRVQALI